MTTKTTAPVRLRKRSAGGWLVTIDSQTIGWVIRDHRINGWRAYTWLPHWTEGVMLADGDGAVRAQSVAAVVRRHQERLADYPSAPWRGLPSA